MIIEIKIANYRSINEEQTISFVADSGRTHPDNLVKRDGLRLLKALALFGPNASGKSNLVLGLWQMRIFITDSATLTTRGDVIWAANPFRLNQESSAAPSRFEVTLLLDNALFTYGFAVTRQRVVEEWLTTERPNGTSKTSWFHRRYDETKGKMEWDFGEPLTKDASLLKERTRDNALVLSVAALFNVTETQPLFDYFYNQIRLANMAQNYENLRIRAMRWYRFNESLQKRVLTLLNSVDIGLESLSVESNRVEGNSQDAFQGEANRDFFGIDSAFETSTGKPNRLVAYRRDTDGKLQRFDFDHEESTGTQRLFTLAVLLLDALDVGAFVLVDELDASLHPLLTERLLEIFQSPELNTKGVQLLFTTHDAILFNPILFRRDQIVLAEKRRGGSRFYALADMEPPPRSTDKFLREYLSGHYGGIPHWGLDYEYIADKVTR